jgi:hypothetical protein
MVTMWIGPRPAFTSLMQRMVAQAGRDGPVGPVRHFRIQVFLANHFLQLREPLGFVLFAQAVLRIGLEVQEVRTDRAVTVLEARQHDAVFHLGHLRAGIDQKPVRRPGRPRRVPDATRALADRPRLEDHGCTAGSDDDRLGLEYVVVTGTHVEANGAGDPVFLRFVHQQVGDADPVEDLVGGFFRRLGHDRLVGLAVDHDLPAAFTLIRTRLGIAHQRQAPLLELVHGRVDVTRHVEQQVLAHHPHQVDTRVADMVFGVVLAPAGAHVAVDRVQALGHGTRTVDVGLFGNDDLLVLPPVSGLESSARSAQSRASDQDVDIVFDDSLVSHQ